MNARVPRLPFSSQNNEEVTFEGDRTSVRPKTHHDLNGEATAFGALQVQLEDQKGEPLPGFNESDCDQWTRDEVSRVVTWRGNHDLSLLSGKPIRVRFRLRNAAIYSFQFGSHEGITKRASLACPGCRQVD